MYASRATFFRLFSATKYARQNTEHTIRTAWKASSVMVAEAYVGGAEIGPYNHIERMEPNRVIIPEKAIAEVRRAKGAVLLVSQAERAGQIEELPETARVRAMYRTKVRSEAG